MLDPIIFSPNCLYQLGPKLKKNMKTLPSRAVPLVLISFSLLHLLPPPLSSPSSPSPPPPSSDDGDGRWRPPLRRWPSGGSGCSGDRAAEAAVAVGWEVVHGQAVSPPPDPTRGETVGRRERPAAAIVL